jgi:hypothetical protein
MRVYAVSVNPIGRLPGYEAIEEGLNKDLESLASAFFEVTVHQMAIAGEGADLVLFLYSYEEEEES